MRDQFVKGLKNIVVKIGTSVLTKNGRFDKKIIGELSGQIAFFLKKGAKVYVVSSGAIGAGMTLLGLKERPKRMEGLQAAAAAGQRYLMQCYEEAFSRRGFSTAQVLLTWDDLSEKKRFMNAKRALKQIQGWGLVPVINENDTVATDEIRFGDNDRLSSLLSILVHADVLVILSNTNGLYADGNPKNPKSRIQLVQRMGDWVFARAKDKRTKFTVGGMRSKLKAVHTCVSSGIPVFLANGRDKKVLARIFKGEDLGTFFVPHLKKGAVRKNWLKHYAHHLRSG
ncbi:MAG: glutamate 5-kinase [Omnitrophica bacterium RIFCSPHIGHO2_02_FULL_51_18]|nr:MAG: glutamate 5-kinase [Omnitrophica bacterium RIFCSPHIGHO2_02_FULL_51_18]